jgi:hypothetical protein
MNRLKLAQRLVAVIGLGVIFAIFGTWVTTLNTPLGWVAYAPLSATPEFPGAVAPWTRLLIWLALIGVWAMASGFIFRQPGSRTLSLGQRVLVVIGWGVALTRFAEWVGTIGFPFGIPVRVSRPLLFSRMQPLPAWELMLVWIGLAVVWATTAMWMLRKPRGPASEAAPSG